MCLLFETLKAENGTICNIDYHQKRVNRTFAALFPGKEPVNLSNAVCGLLIPEKGLFRVRITYGAETSKTEIFPYIRRSIRRLILIEAAGVSYPYKYDDRTALTIHAKNLPADSEPLFTVNGNVTDTSFSNTAFFDGEKWFTPDTCLLRGTKRDFYLDNGFMSERRITAEDIYKYEKVSLINAMCDIGDIILNTGDIVGTG